MRLQSPSVIVPARLFTALQFLLLSCLALCISENVMSAEDDSAHLQARKKTAPYYQDAQICRSRSKMDPLPEGADPAITIDPSKYLTCINQMGYHQEAKTDPFLVAINRCHSQRTKSVSASGETQFRAPSQAQVRACLSARGFPSAGSPPNPNAPVTTLHGSAALDSGTVKKAPTSQATTPPVPAQNSGSEDGSIETVIIPPRTR